MKIKFKNIIFIISLVLPILSYGQATRVTLSQLAQSGATDGQFVKWNNSTLTWEAGPGSTLSGTQNYIPYFNTSSTLSSSGLLWNNTSTRLSLNTTASNAKVTLKNGTKSSSLTTVLATQTFDATTNWSTGTNWSITGGKAQASSASSSYLTYTPSLSFVAGQPYLITLSISEWTSGAMRVELGSTVQFIFGTFSKDNYQIIIRPNSAGTVFRILASSGLSVKLDNIKIETWTSLNLPIFSIEDSTSLNYIYQSFPQANSVYLGDRGSVLNANMNAVSVGVGALSNLHSGSLNTAVGAFSMSKNVDGVSNTAVGAYSLQNLSSGNYNFALGENAMGSSYNGNSNIAIGSASYFYGNGNNNIVIGTNAANTNVVYLKGNSNIIIGDSTGTNMINTTSRNILIGSNLFLANSGASNQINIGNIIFGTSVSGTGTTIAGKIGIGIANPSARLHIKGEGSLSSSTSFLVRNSLDTTLLFVRDDIKVGIGTTSIDPTAGGANLTIGSSSGGSVSLRSGSTLVGRFQANSSQVELYTPAGSSEILLTTNATPRVYVKSDGKVGIGTDTPKNTLQVTGSFGRTPPTIVADDISYTVDSYTNPDSWVIFTAASSSTITLTLPTASNFTGREITFRTINNITVNTNTNIYGPSYTLTTSFLSGAGKNATLVSDGTYWVVVSTN